MAYKPFKMKGSPMKRNFGIGASPAKKTGVWEVGEDLEPIRITEDEAKEKEKNTGSMTTAGDKESHKSYADRYPGQIIRDLSHGEEKIKKDTERLTKSENISQEDKDWLAKSAEETIKRDKGKMKGKEYTARSGYTREYSPREQIEMDKKRQARKEAAAETPAKKK